MTLNYIQSNYERIQPNPEKIVENYKESDRI